MVAGDEPIGEGHHAELGSPHAEVAALDECRRRGADPAGATLYVTLEPCAHHGRQPPCTDAIVAAGIGRVVVASEDPSEKASGRGPGILRDEGIEVTFAEGAVAAAARRVNQAFRKHARTGRPLVALKSALTLDGRVATESGDSKWISGEASRALVHEWRAEVDAVVVGIGTALADDPLLTSRPAASSAARPGAAGSLESPRQPARVVFDSRARLPLDSALVRSAHGAPLLVIAAPEAPDERTGRLRGAGAEVVAVGGSPRDRVRSALAELGRRDITSVMLEGGPILAGSFFGAGEVDELRLFFAPRLLGGGRPLVEGAGPDRIADAERALSVDWERVCEDLLLRARLREW